MTLTNKTKDGLTALERLVRSEFAVFNSVTDLAHVNALAKSVALVLMVETLRTNRFDLVGPIATVVVVVTDQRLQHAYLLEHHTDTQAAATARHISTASH